MEPNFKVCKKEKQQVAFLTQAEQFSLCTNQAIQSMINKSKIPLAGGVPSSLRADMSVMDFQIS